MGVCGCGSLDITVYVSVWVGVGVIVWKCVGNCGFDCVGGSVWVRLRG